RAQNLAAIEHALQAMPDAQSRLNQFNTLNH
ncbi:MAG: hypothetical protein RLZ51_2295, partial [Pseudomonadota bacterium]